jgi:hypothetical protein
MPLLLIWILFGIAAVIVASQKNRSGCAWFALGFLLGPFGLLFALLLPSLPSSSTDQNASPPSLPSAPLDPSLASDTKICPHCAETIKLAAKKCRFCGEVLSDDQVDAEISARRAAVEEDLARQLAGQLRCPFCGSWDVSPNAFHPDGSFGPWCPHCQKALPFNPK